MPKIDLDAPISGDHIDITAPPVSCIKEKFMECANPIVVNNPNHEWNKDPETRYAVDGGGSVGVDGDYKSDQQLENDRMENDQQANVIDKDSGSSMNDYLSSKGFDM